MTIHCVACRRLIQIPDARASNPRLKIKCGCGALFVLHEAAIAAQPAQAVSSPPRTAAPTPPSVQPPERGPVMPRTQSPAPARPPEPARVSFQATSSVGSAGEPQGGSPRGTAWRRCASHPQVRSANVCPKCFTGYCPECQHKVGVSVVCTKCEVICVEADVYEDRLHRERQRARPMMEELSTIFGYPLRDPMAYVMLAVFTWVFAALGNVAVLYGKAAAFLFSQGVLMAYCFSALSRVSAGNLKDFMPDIGDASDLVRTLRLGGTALLAGSGPLLLLMLLIPGLGLMGGFGQAREPQEATVPHQAPVPPAFDGDAPAPAEVEPVASEAPPPPDAAEGLRLLGVAASVIVFGGIGLVWKVIYTPAALTVAGISRSSLSTLNPVVGFDVIRRMGGTYWQAMGIYTVIAAAEWMIGFIFGFIPVLGGIVQAFVDAYAYLMIGCTLGLAVFKKGPELGLD